MSNEAAALHEGALVDRVPVALTIVHDPAAPGEGYVRPGERLSHDLPGLDELIQYGSAKLVPRAEAAEPSGDPIRWIAKIHLEKYNDTHHAGDSEQRAADPSIAPDEVIDREHNLLLIGGASSFWEFAIGNGTTTAAQALTYFNNAQGQLGVGDSTTAAADTQTDLQAATNKTYKAMDATYPQHSDSTSVTGAKSITFKSTFGTTDANYAWNEWVTRNGTRSLNRKQESLGTKTSSATWTLTVTLSLA